MHPQNSLTAPASSRPPLGRLLTIARIALRYRLDLILRDAIDALVSEPRLKQRLLRRLFTTRLPYSGPYPGNEGASVRLRLALEALGPVFIKLGQALSTRRDLLPSAYADELAKLQDRVPPFATEIALKRIDDELNGADRHFQQIEPKPLASASLAQVHAAQLLDGREVVIKVIRPDLEQVIRDDLKVLHWLAGRLHRVSAEAARLHLPQVVADYEQVILNELDLEHEADNTEALKANFASSPLLYVPQIIRAASTRNVLTMERLSGVPVGDIEALRRANVDFKVLAERGVEIFFTQVFVHNFFHADMHPGNILVDTSTPTAPQYQAIDCAIIGSLSTDDQEYLARNLAAFFRRDYAEVVRLHVTSGWVPPTTDVRAFERVIRNVCEPIFQKPLAEISFGEFLLTLFQTARRFDMQVQPQLVLLQKTLLAVEGLGRQLYPALDLWQTARPFMERWMAERTGIFGAIAFLRREAPRLIDALPRVIREQQALVLSLKSNDLQHRATQESLRDLIVSQHQRQRSDRWLGLGLALAATGLIIADRGELAAALSAGAGLWLWIRT